MAFGEHTTRKANEGTWTSVVFDTDRVTLAEIERPLEGKPRVNACEGYAREGGELETLRRLKNARRLARQRCTTLLNEGDYQLLQVDLPANAADLPRDELREAMRWRVKEMVDFPVEQAGIDLLDIPETGNRARQLWVVIAGHPALRPRIHAFQDAKIDLGAIDIPELAQRNLATLFEEANRGLALLSFDRHGGRLTVTYRGELYMTRHIDIKAPDLAGPEAELLHERVLLDVQRSLDNFDRNFSAVTLTRLLVGPLVSGTGFIDYLRANLSLPVASADLADVLDFARVPELAQADRQAEAWLALGAALRE